MSVFQVGLPPDRADAPKSHPSPGTKVRPAPTSAGPRSDIQPVVTAAAMMMGGWVSWEMVHFISESGLTREAR